MADGATLEQELERLLEQETFAPPAEFVEQAAVTDRSEVDSRAADDHEAFWEEQAEALD